MKKTLTFFVLLLSLSFLFSETIRYEDSWGTAGFNLSQSRSNGVNVIFSIENFTISTNRINGEEMQIIELPGSFLQNDEGAPNLPSNGRYIAMPQGSRAEFRIVSSRTETYQNIELAPAPRIPLETEDGPLEYNKNMNLYSRNAYYPESPVQLSNQTLVRGVDAVILGITPFQYNPVTKELVVYRDLEVEVNFVGGNGHIGSDNLRSRWWDPIFADMFLNYESLPEIDYSSRNRTREGADYLIISPDDPTFLAWADSIRIFRNEQGISTVIKTTAEIGGNTTTAIEGYINSIMDPNTGWDPAPAAILLLGDYGVSGNTIVSPIWDNYCVSDNIYADVSGNSMPDVVLARMTAQNETHLNTMITKFLNYERTPPTNPDYYDHPITALGWQTERWFQICSETVGGYFLHEQGKNPVRINAIYSGTPSTVWSTATNTSTVVNYFGPNGHGYIPQTPAELGGWSGGNATQVNNAINSGAFILQHRDHGYEQGWGEPAYSSSNINGLTNTDLTFVFSINCLTGKYNMAGECFAEKFHRYTYNGQNSGALGIIAASEVSYSFVNDTFVWGMYDNMWPDFMPDYGTTPESRDVMPAFGNAAGKYFLQQSNWPYNTNNKEVTYNLFHHHGDAFTTVYSEMPQNLTVVHDPVLLGGVDSFSVTANLGSFIALTVNNEIIGTAEGTGTPVSISIPSQLPGEEMLVTITKQNYFRYTSIVPVIPPSGPYVVYNNLTIDDTNGNGNVEYSEDILLSIDLENIGSDDATDVNVTISTNDDYVDITDDNEYYGFIPAGNIVSMTNAFAFTVDDYCPDQHDVIFELNATDGVETWISYFAITLFAPILEIGDMTIDDSNGNDNGVMDPGETVEITIPVSNTGLADSPDALATLSCATPGISMQTATINLGVIELETYEDAVFTVTADSSVPFGTPIILHLNITADAFQVEEDFPTQVGIFVEDFENGGFADYPWEMQGYEISWPNVNPIEEYTIVGPIDDVHWSIDTNEFYNGSASAKSFPITHNQASLMQVTLDITQDGEISFWSKVACEYSPSQEYFYDGLMFFIDDTVIDYFQPDENGQSPWTFSNYPVTTGTHTFTWAYVKDGSDGSTFISDDCAWVDYITFPPMIAAATGTLVGTVTLIPAANVEEVEIIVGSITLHPDASGQFMAEIPVGIYDVTAFLDSYEIITAYNVEILENLPTALSFELYYLQAPENLTAENNDDVVDLSWDYIQPVVNRELQGFNVYRNIDGGDFEIIATTSEFNYQDILPAAGEYEYYITAMYAQENESDPSNTETITWDGTGSDDPMLPQVNALYQNSPNPFNPETRINFDLKSDVQVSLEIYNMKGQKVKQLVNDQLSARQHSVVWDGEDSNNKRVSSGIYLYRLQTPTKILTKKMLLLK